MSLSIQNDSGTLGGGDGVDAATVQLHLIAITRDTNIGEGTTAGDLVPVTYTGAAADAPATRISDIANTAFNVKAGRPDIIILGVGPNFALLDGTVLCGNGVTIFPTAPDASAAQVNPDNPTGSIYIIYDVTNGNSGGILVRAPGGSTDPSTYTTPTPSPDVLFHELSHAFRLAQAAGVAGAPPVQADDEVPAIMDENILRPLLGVGLRDTNPPHDGTAPSCGGPAGSQNCCVVATISTGSPYSDEINRLRLIRDRVLRNSDIGYDFFHHLHHDYYAFSPEVCRLMAGSPDLQAKVARYFVGPLARMLGLMYRRNFERLDATALASEFMAAVRSSELSELGEDELGEALALLGAAKAGDLALPPSFAALASHLRGAATESAFVKWALLEPVELYVRALAWLQSSTLAELGALLCREFDSWAGRFPLTEAWRDLSDLGFERELAFISRALMPGPEARAILGDRLAALIDARPTGRTVLRRAGYLPEED